MMMLGDDKTWIPLTPPAKSLQPQPQGVGEILLESDSALYPEESVKMNETTRKRTKMKRHRPKVLNTNKPKRTPQQKTPNPRTPKTANEKMREKRKCNVKRRKMAANHINGVDGVTTNNHINYVDKKINEVDEASTNKITRPAPYSCIQRKLDFNLEQNESSMITDDPGSSFEDFGIGKVDVKVPDTLKTYKRRFWPNDCLKNSRRLAPIFPIMFKRIRMKQQKRIDISKLSMLLPTEREVGLVMVDPILFGCFCNLLPMVKTRKKRSMRNVGLKLSCFPRWTRSKRYPPRTRSKRYPREGFTFFIQNFTDSYSQVQDKVNPNLTDQMEEHDLATNNVNVEDQLEEEDIATNNVDVLSHRRNINKGPVNHSLELIPRKFPPNLNQDYVLTCRDGAGCLEALIDYTTMKFESLRVSSKYKGKYQIKATLKKPIGKQKKIPKKPKKAKIFIDFDEESLEIWNLMKDDGTWDWKQILDGNYLLEYHIEDENTNPEMSNCIELLGNGRESRNKLEILDNGIESRNNLEILDNEYAGGVENYRAEYWKRAGQDFILQIKSFIYNMGEFLGDRSFSRWKGSVVDSIVGVYLTQNVTDQLSSNAFLSLAAKYPPPSIENIIPESTERDSAYLGVLTLDEGQILENGTETCLLTTDEIISSSIEESIGNQTHERDSYDQILEGGSQTCDYSTTKMSCLTEDDLLEDDTGYPKTTCQLEVTPGEYISSSFDNPVGVEVNNCDIASSQLSVDSGKVKDKREIEIDWDELRRKYKNSGHETGETDTVDWEAVRLAPVKDIAEVIKARGMNNILAKKIQDFLNRLVEKHGSIDLEWLRNVPPDKAKDYLLSYEGLGPKSVECVRLLELEMVAFPVDVNVARILVRLGWVPLQPLPDNLPLHLLNTYPELSSVQKYIWPRLSLLPGSILYKLHHLLIASGKMFCTKINPKCEDCPMKSSCKHYESKTKSSKLCLPEPANSSKPIIEFPPSPGPAEREIRDIEDFSCKPKFEKLRTVHEVFVLPDADPLLAGFPKRVSEDEVDGNHYLLAVWSEGDDGANYSQQSDECATLNIVNFAGTILMPARTIVRGAFPLNGTYFQPNEVFADHETSVKPIHFPAHWTLAFQKTKLHCGTNYRAICSDMSGIDIKRFFRKGEFGCNRGFDRATRKPQDLSTKFHVCKSRKNDDEDS